MRGIDDEGTGAAIVVEGREGRAQKRKKLRPWDEALRQSRYAKALDLVLDPTLNKSNGGKGKSAGQESQGTDPTVVLTLLTALVHRSALKTALKDRTAVTLTPLLSWLAKHVVDPRHTVLITRVCMLVLELYAPELGRDAEVDRLVERLHDRVRELVEGAQVAESTRGMLEGVMG